MPRPQPTASSRQDQAAILRAWRELTGIAPSKREVGAERRRGRATLIACSGGGDSMALLVALAGASAGERAGLVVGHVLHDLRPAEQAYADRDAVRRAAEECGLEFLEAFVWVRSRGGNAEDAARMLRYQALAAMARSRAIGWVATAHHGDDQLETILMALLRGAGPRGLAGMPATRTMPRAWDVLRPPGAAGIQIVRPMLGVPDRAIGREVCREICRRAGVVWQEDATNQDTSRLRSAVRNLVVPEIVALRPRAVERACRSARLLADADAIVREQRDRLIRRARRSAQASGAWTIPASALAGEPALIVGAVIRRMVQRIGGSKGLDALSGRALDPVVRAIRLPPSGVRRFGLAGIQVVVEQNSVMFVSSAPVSAAPTKEMS